MLAPTSYSVVALAAIVACATFQSTSALATYLTELPNGSSFAQALGHPDNDSSQYTDFATDFAAAGHSWTATFCAATFPGATMTNGAAFGDPCCTWVKGGTADFTVTAFTTTPGEATVCASSSAAASTAASTASSAAAETEAPATTTEAPAATDAATTTEAPATDAPAATEAPAATDSSTSVSQQTPTATEAPATTEAPAATDATTPSTGGCKVRSLRQ
ncbi:hypothetical protein BBJ28_00017425 [Nothophytophthora sp. Chile5]|nr:hypothetical protein BBJ28_00017425 [Nothophytophthora sp. Chile5]